MDSDQDLNDEKLVKKELEKEKIDFEKISGELFICPECREVPKILDAHSENNKFIFNCKNCGLKEQSIKEYFQSIIDSKKKYRENVCKNCEHPNNIVNTDFYYCNDCKKEFCSERIQFCNDAGHKTFNVNDRINKCRIHQEKNVYFCFDCKENFCDKLSEHQEHDEHNIKKINEIEINIEKKEKKKINFFFLENRNKILERNKYLSDLVRFNRLILKIGEKFQNNYFNLENVIKLGKSIEEENKRDSNDIDYNFKDFTTYIEISTKAIKNITDIKEDNKEKILLSRKDIFLHLFNRKLENKDFESISNIRFNQLNEINLSGNSIENIQSMNKMILPFLEYLNLSNNKIKNIEPIANLKSKRLKEIFLHHNEIEDISAFEGSEFPNLKIFRIEGNKNLVKIGDKVLKKFKKSIITEEQTIEKFNEKYNCKIEIESKKIDLKDIKEGDEMVKDLYLTLTNKADYINIEKLCLLNNKINDPSPLSRIPFMDSLEELDLSLNKIKNLNFLDKMKLKHLKKLYLSDNKINNIYPLKKIELNDLETLAILNNNLNLDNYTTKDVLKFFKEKKIVVDLFETS